MNKLLEDIRNCKTCLSYLPHGVNPILSAHKESIIAIVGQAPGSIVHQTSIAWDDKSGERLRDWLNVDKTVFYNSEKVAIIPMGFCYPGKGKTGDLPPRNECAPQWHELLFKQMNNLELVILIGAYAQKYYLKDRRKRNLTETVRTYIDYLPKYFVLPHPSPRNNIWIKKNPWFQKQLLPELKHLIYGLGLSNEMV